MADLKEFLKTVENMTSEEIYMILRSFGYSGDVEDLNNETKALFEQELGFVAGGINSFSKRLGSGIISLLPFVPSNAFADDLNKPVTSPASKVVDNNGSKKINWQYITNKGKRLAKDINLPDKKTIGALSVNSLVMLALGYGLKSLTTPSGAMELSPEQMNKTQQLAKSSAEKDFESKNFGAWKSGLKDLLITWFFDEEDKKRGIDLSVVVKADIYLELLRSGTWLNTIYVNFKNQEMPLRNYIEQAVKNKKYRYSPDLIVYLLGVYNNIYIDSYDFASNNKQLKRKESAVCELENNISVREQALKEAGEKITELKDQIKVPERFTSDDVKEIDQILSFALEVAYKRGLNPTRGAVGSVSAFSWVLDDILKRYSTLETTAGVYYNVGETKLLNSEPLTMQELGQYYAIRIAPDGDFLPFTKGIKVLQQKYDLPFDKNFMLTLAQSCQKMFLLGAEKANEFDRLNNEVDRMYAGYDYQFDEIGHTYHPEDYNKKELKDKMNVNSRRKKEHKTAKTFERFMRKVAEKSRKKFEDNSYVEISELINCIDDPELLKLFSDNSNDFMKKSRRKKDNIEFDYEDIYSEELPENENYLDIDDDLENPVTETQDDEIITSDTVLSDNEKPVILPDNPRDDATIKLNPTRTKQRQTEIKNLKSKQKKSAWYIQKQYEPKETTYDITPKTGKIRKTKK